MRYALATIRHDRKRYFAGVCAIAFAAVLTAMQTGILIGLVSTVSAPVDRSTADVWLAAPKTQSCDGGWPISKRWRNRMIAHPEIEATDEFVEAFSYWKHPDVGVVLCLVVGCNLDEDNLGPSDILTPEQRIALTEPNAVIVDRVDGRRLGVRHVGELAEIRGRRVRVVGFVEDMGSMTGPYVFCSRPTARRMLFLRPDETTYLLGRLKDKKRMPEVLESLARLPEVSVYTQDEFSWKSRLYWIMTTKAGASVSFVAALGLVVGVIVTSQTLYAATNASLKELAVLRALGVPRWRMSLFVLEQAMVLGILGLAIGLPLSHVLAQVVYVIGARALLPAWLMVLTSVVTLATAAVSGLIALRSLRQIDPAVLLR